MTAVNADLAYTPLNLINTCITLNAPQLVTDKKDKTQSWALEELHGRK